MFGMSEGRARRVASWMMQVCSWGMDAPSTDHPEHMPNMKIDCDNQGVFFSFVSFFFGQAKKKGTRPSGRKN